MRCLDLSVIEERVLPCDVSIGVDFHDVEGMKSSAILTQRLKGQRPIERPMPFTEQQPVRFDTKAWVSLEHLGEFLA